MEFAVNIPEQEPHVGQLTCSSEQHAGSDLVAVGDAHQAVDAVRFAHGLHGIRDELARGQRVFHAHVPHGDAIVHRDGVELERDGSRIPDGLLDDFSHRLKMGVPRDEIGVGIGDRDERLPEVVLLPNGARRPQQGAVRRPGEPQLHFV